MDFILGLIGFIGGIICAVADIFLDLKGRDNEKIGKLKLIDSNWVKMASWRFPLSINIAAIAVPMYYMGFIAMTNQLRNESVVLSNIFWISATIGALGGLFIHATVCYYPMIYKRLSDEGKSKLAEDIIQDMFRSIQFPFVIFFVLLTIITSIVIIIAILNKDLSISPIFLLLNPMVLTIIGITLRLIRPKAFGDLPGICMPSIGLAMIGLAAALNSLM